MGDLTWALSPFLLGVSKLFLRSANLDHDGGSGILKRVLLRLRQMKVFWKGDILPHLFHQSARESKVILTLRETTSGAASTGVADLEAAPEMAKTKSLKDYLEPAVAQAVPSIHFLEGNGLRDGKAMTCSDGESRFCRPFRWRDAGASMVA